jgi:1,4-alpha-glucan branching enzyme
MVRRFVKDNALMWLGEYRVDGFRWDSTVNIRAYDMGNKPLPAGQQMLDEVNAAIRDAFPRRLSIAEDSLNIGTFDGSWDYDFHHSVMGELKAKDDADRRISSIGNTIASRPEMRRVIYVDNHDEAGKLNGQSRIANDAAPSDPSGDLARRISGLGRAVHPDRARHAAAVYGQRISADRLLSRRPCNWIGASVPATPACWPCTAT